MLFKIDVLKNVTGKHVRWSLFLIKLQTWRPATLLKKRFQHRCFPVKFVEFLTLSVQEKLRNSIFEMPKIKQTLNINNLRTTSAKSVNLHTITKLIEYSLKNVHVKAMLTLTVFEIFLFEVREHYQPPSGISGSEWVKVLVKNQKNIWILLKLLEKWLTYKLRRLWMVFFV